MSSVADTLRRSCTVLRHGRRPSPTYARQRAPMPSLVVEVRVAVGDRVEKGQAFVVLESMKTETALRAPADGIIKAIGCVKGEMVEEGGELVDIEESEE
jgi:3-methylcrotonyl-CoA carboxylase alpha subunit